MVEHLFAGVQLFYNAKEKLCPLQNSTDVLKNYLLMALSEDESSSVNSPNEDAERTLFLEERGNFLNLPTNKRASVKKHRSKQFGERRVVRLVPNSARFG